MDPSAPPMSAENRPENARHAHADALLEVIEELRSAVADALDSSVPAGSGARSVGRSLGLTKTMGWKLWTIATCGEHERVLEAIPGERGWRTMMMALEASCPARSKVARVRSAMDALRRAASGGDGGGEPRSPDDPAVSVHLTRARTSYEVILAPRDGRTLLIPLRAEVALIDLVLCRDDGAPRAELRVAPPGAGHRGSWEHWTPLLPVIEPVARLEHPDGLRDGAAPSAHDLLLLEALREAGIDGGASRVLRYRVSEPPRRAALVLRKDPVAE